MKHRSGVGVEKIRLRTPQDYMSRRFSTGVDIFNWNKTRSKSDFFIIVFLRYRY